MRRIAVAAVASLLAGLVVTGLVMTGLVVTGQVAAQQRPSISADPPAVPGEGTYDFTITGSGWTPGSVIFVGLDPRLRDIRRAMHPNFAFGAGDATVTESNAVPILFMAADGEAAQAYRDGFSDVVGGVRLSSTRIHALAQTGMFDGSLCGVDMFCPDEPIERSTMAVWLIRALGDSEPSAAGATRFADIDAGQWWAPHVERLADLEITVGCKREPLRYCPNRPVTRAQMATFLARALGVNTTPQANTYKAIGAGGSCAIRTDDTITCWGNDWRGNKYAPAGTYKTVAAGFGHACAIRTDDTITCWGDNSNGQTDSPAGTYKTVAAGSQHSCAIGTDDTVICWGPPPPPAGFRWVGQ